MAMMRGASMLPLGLLLCASAATIAGCSDNDDRRLGGQSGANSAGGMGMGGASGGAPGGSLETFSFFVTSLESIQQVSGDANGFGGDLRFGETGDGAGLRGADKICKSIAEIGMPGAGNKDWRAFLSATSGGPDGGPLHARTRVGNGPWYDALGRLVAQTLADLLAGNRPRGADPAIANDLPNEFGVPNHHAGKPGCSTDCPDNHQVLTGTNCKGELYTAGGFGLGPNEFTTDCTTLADVPDAVPNPAYTCNDWTSKEPEGTPWCGHSWPRSASGLSWMSAERDGGCAPCVNLTEAGGVSAACVGSAGGYGGFYCFEYRP